MKQTTWDVIIVGQGLAGTTLAWSLLRRGLQVMIVDRGEKVTASRIAAGLITPITGPRMAITWNWDVCWPIAHEFYRSIEQKTGATLLQVDPAVQLYQSAEKRETFERRMSQPEFHSLVRSDEKLVNPDWFDAPWGGFEMFPAARLNVASYLDVSRASFRRASGSISADIDFPADVEVQGDLVALPRLDLRGRKLICCQGFQQQAAAGWEAVQFNPAQGEILTIRAPGISERRAIHCGGWIAPAGPEEFRVGSTFNWEQLDGRPTPTGREQLLALAKAFMRFPLQVTAHQAAVRPTMRDFRPVAGLHPQTPQLGIFNGLGTKGSLMAPWLAECFAEHLTRGTPLPREVEARRWFH